MKKLATLLLAALMLLSVAGQVAAQEAPYNTTGKVSLAVPAGELAEISPLMDVFRATYPGIELTVIPFDGESGPYLTAMATAGTMPDVLWGDWTDFTYAVSNGYVRPLDDLLDKDPEAEHLPGSLVFPYVYNGKTYAVPDQIHARMIAMNTDLIDELNLDKPRYDWTLDEFKDILKVATTDKTAGAAVLYDLDSVISAQDSAFWSPAYNYEDHSFHFAEKWLPGINLLNELRAIPGLDVWKMRNNGAGAQEGESNDYTVKFGEAGVNDNHYSFKEGFALLATGASWEANWMRAQVKPNWEYWPYPRMNEESPIKVPVHVNHTYMMSTVAEENVPAAYEVLKWVSFGREGNINKMDIFAARPADEQADGKLYFLWYFPSTQHPDVVAKFADNPYVTEGLKVVYANIINCFRDDLNKILPGYNLIFDDQVWQLLNGARNGEMDAASVATQLDEIVNPRVKEQWAAFEALLADHK
ncbi:MAG TPA: extracellular solute-binding protein [Clostridia bacterium]|jgi:ABC-type glycerol-3-phosphate transport system substrate-binding protein|nr:extracellular solute-binding protein [Clostridia bacterium]HPY43763.1 extracellular solute-binding protein [Clostridia bacterium]HQA96408.1 extracellular solute-binding protein [Clostridia bacterium]HQO56058.1 extracellular solute-binding protein [Clostridia bacterium]HUM59919.1 extracellular solute-binding protein [Clostridia bacterium]